jgi:hypothetical protein
VTDKPTLPSTPVTTTEIADLLAWTRRLGTQRRHADPAERAAYQAAKAALLARITGNHPDHTAGDGGGA